jgi:NADH-quinone oxidoreductase subunit L
MGIGELVILVPILPLLGFIINGLIGFRFPKKLVALIGCGFPLLSLLVAILIASQRNGIKCTHKLFNWVNIQGLSIDFVLKVDDLSCVTMLIVAGVGTIIHLYSIGYMGKDKGFARYFSFLNLFMFAMLTLVLADNLVLMFLGWEGVGLCSYLLIGFWYEDFAKATAGKKAFIVTRLGDLGFILGLFLIFTTYGTFSISAIETKGIATTAITTFITLLLFVGACGKSAQIPLYVWLPDAMAGPTPVSALIHAATMVTAGVYMLARLNFLYINAPITMEVVGIIAGATALYSAVIAIAQTNIKKILAYSTISQLGFMFTAEAARDFGTSIFHLMTHAFFKALLFLSAGAVIHAIAGEEDIRKMGGLKRHLGFVFLSFVIGALALAGIPPLAGFFSKDEILISVYEKSQDAGIIWTFIWLALCITCFLTAFYIFRLIFITFLGKSNVEEEKLKHLHKPDLSMNFALFVLSILSIIGGMFGSPIEGLSISKLSHSAHNLNLVISISLGIAGIVLAGILYLWKTELPRKIADLSAMTKFVHKVVANKFYVDELYDLVIAKPLRALAWGLWYAIDRIVIDKIFVDGLGVISFWFGDKARKLQMGFVNFALGVFLLGAIGFILYVLIQQGYLRF